LANYGTTREQALPIEWEGSVGRSAIDIAVFPEEKASHRICVRGRAHHQEHLGFIREQVFDNAEIVLIQVQPRARVAAEEAGHICAARQTRAQSLALLYRECVRIAAQVLAGDQFKIVDQHRPRFVGQMLAQQNTTHFPTTWADA
jgi:hypothetical protein